MVTDDLNDMDLAVGEVFEIEGGQNHYAIMGLFYRLNYAYKNGRYLLETSGRYDGTSRFKSGHRWGFFPSVSAGWRISEENFFKPVEDVVSNMKLRVSCGSLGNQDVGYYDYLQTINTSSLLDYSFGEGALSTSAKVSDPNSSDLTWETVTTYNVGLDVGMFKNRFNIVADAYIRDTKNMLTLGLELPGVYGANEPKTNAADLRTRGWEFSMSWRDKVRLLSKQLNYSVSVGLADNTSVITRFDNPDNTIGSYYEGQTLGEIWGYRVDGLFQTDEEAQSYTVDQGSVNNTIETAAINPGLHAGDLKYLDLNGNGRIDKGNGTVDKPGDMTVIGNSLPRYTYSTNFTLDWNGIDFSLFLQGVGVQNWYPNKNARLFWGPYTRAYVAFVPKDFMSEVWSPSNPDAYFPRPLTTQALQSGSQLSTVNDRYLQNIGYLRVKNITLGYTLPSDLTTKIGISKLRVYLSGENLFTFSSLKTDYIDPEQAAAGNSITSGTSDANSYPWQKTYSVGVNVNF